MHVVKISDELPVHRGWRHLAQASRRLAGSEHASLASAAAALHKHLPVAHMGYALIWALITADVMDGLKGAMAFMEGSEPMNAVSSCIQVLTGSADWVSQDTPIFKPGID